MCTRWITRLFSRIKLIPLEFGSGSLWNSQFVERDGLQILRVIRCELASSTNNWLDYATNVVNPTMR